MILILYVLRYIDISRIAVKMGEGKEREKEGKGQHGERGKGGVGRKEKRG